MRWILIVWMAMVTGCGQADYLPKPKGYNRIDLPQPAFQLLPDTLPYRFEYSQHATFEKHDSWITERYWIDILYTDFDASVQLTYKPIRQNPELLREYLGDAYKLTSQHNIKAYSIEEKILSLPNGTWASVTELEGEVPTQLHFHATDSVEHFLRGALYFKTSTKNDSLAPVIRYIKQDMLRLLETLEWQY